MSDNIQDDSKVVVLLGGGIDGYAVMLYLKFELELENVVAIHVDYGQAAANAEYSACEEQTRYCDYRLIREVDRDQLILLQNKGGSLIFGDKDKPPMAYARNLILLLKAMQYGNTIYMGLDKPYHGQPPYFDCTLEYFQQAVKLTGRTDCTVAAPYIDTPKLEVVKKALTRDPEFFNRVMTCWTPVNGKPCGECRHCKTQQDIIFKLDHYEVVCDEQMNDPATLDPEAMKVETYLQIPSDMTVVSEEEFDQQLEDILEASHSDEAIDAAEALIVKKLVDVDDDDYSFGDKKDD